MQKSKLWLRLLLVGMSITTFFMASPALAAPRQVSALTTGSAACQSSAQNPQPTAQSLLVVLLDRSTSLDATDPYEYSDSVTKVLADLWPGRMAVIFFSGGRLAAQPMLGPVDLSQPEVRDTLKNQIESWRHKLSGWTPTQIAVEQAEQLLAQEHYPSGSKVVLITDGQPALPNDRMGAKEVAAIEQQDAPVFASNNVTISTLGLGNQVLSYAQAFLQKVATETHGAFHDVTDPAQLALPVLQMYSCWQGLNFVPTSGSGHNAFNIDTYAGQVDFVTFLQDRDAYPVTLLGLNNQPVPAQNLQDQSQDIHYEFDRLAITRFNTAGTYTIQTADPTAQTYALEQTRLQAEIVSPIPQTPVYAGQPLTVKVALYDNNNPQQHVYPGSGTVVTIGLTYTLTANGKLVDSGEETLTQEAAPNNDLFTASITPRQTGKLTIAVSASYQYIPLSTEPNIVLQVQPALCTSAGCFAQHYGAILVLLLLVLLLLALFLWFWLRPAPFGVLKDTQGFSRVLGSNRSLTHRILHKSIIYSEELRSIGWEGASFTLRFKRHKQVFISARGGASSLAVWCTRAEPGQEMQFIKAGLAVPLHNGDRIVVSGQPRATFYASGSQVQSSDWSF